MDLSQLSDVSQFAGDLCYLFLAIDAFWGAYCVAVIWRRVAQLRFRREADQEAFLSRWETAVTGGDDISAGQIAENESRVVAQLARVALDNSHLASAPLRHLLSDRYRRDVSADLEYRLDRKSTRLNSS